MVLDVREWDSSNYAVQQGNSGEDPDRVVLSSEWLTQWLQATPGEEPDVEEAQPPADPSLGSQGARVSKQE